MAVVLVALEERMAPEETDQTREAGSRGSVITAVGTLLVWLVYGIVVRDGSAIAGGVLGLVVVAVVVAVRRRRHQ